MKKLPKNYISFLSLEETLDAKHKMHNFLLNDLVSSFNLVHIDTPIIAYKSSMYKSNNYMENRPINFDITYSSDVLELFTNFDKWKIYFLYTHNIIDKYNGILTESFYVKRDIEELTNVNTFLEEDLEVELIINDSNYKKDHYSVYVEKTFRILSKLQDKFIEITQNKIPRSLPETYSSYEWPNLKAANENLTDEDILISEIKNNGIIFVHNGITCMSAPKFNWSKIPDLNHNQLQGSFLVYNAYSKEAYNIASVFLRVNQKTLTDQIESEKKHFLKENKINKLILEKKIPITVGIKFHKSKLNTFLMQKCHIAEVQPNIWSDEIKEQFKLHNIDFL